MIIATKVRIRLIAGLAACAIGSSAIADPLIFVPSDALANDMLTSMLAEEVLRDANGSKQRSAKRSYADARSKVNSAFVPQQAPGSFISKLAAHYPPGKRVEVTRTFNEMFVGYQKIEAQFGIPKNDLAGAVAAFIAGNFMAYRDVDFPDANFVPLVNQMRSIISGNATFAQSTAGEKQDMYEQMAILGTYMALTRDALKKQPNTQTQANLKQAAKGYLEQFLKTDADRVQITANGLVLK
jgi:hypothetical protein